MLALTGFGCRDRSETEQVEAKELEMWGLWQETEQIRPVLEAYEEQTGTKVNYRKIASLGTYEKDLLAALAEGRGPDIFVIHHTWVDAKAGIMSPAPGTVIDERAVKEEFVDVVAKDVVRGEQVWALPTSVDNLALFYNKDILNSAGIAQPPATWNQFQQMVERVSEFSPTGTILQSAATLGVAGNVNRASDILQLLMMQSGMTIIDEKTGRADINSDLGARALTFYTDFANKNKKVYTWDATQDFSIDAFAQGKAATMINYSYHIPTVKAKNPRLNFAVAPVPQISDDPEEFRASFAAYWPFAVSSSSTEQTAAWNFLRFLTGKEASTTLNQAQKLPPARKDSVNDFARDPELGVFAEQTLISTTWPRFDVTAIDAIFNTMIDDVISGSISTEDGLKRSEDQVNQLTPNDV